MKKLMAVLIAAVVLSTVAQAGFTDFDCYFPDDPDAQIHNWYFRAFNNQGVEQGYIHNGNGTVGTLDPAASYKLELGERLSEMGPDEVEMSGMTSSDPNFTLIKTVENVTGVTWTAYQLVLDPVGVATFVPGTEGSTRFTDISFSADLKTITFAEPLAVPDGDTVTLQVDINIPTTGSFGFNVCQHPIPEPATVALLGLGALVLIRTRKK